MYKINYDYIDSSNTKQGKKHGSQQLKEYDIFNKTQIINSDFDKFTKKINSIKKWTDEKN